MYNKKTILKEVNQIRKEIGHEIVEITIKELIYDKNINELWIITEDRPDKSALIGKGGWVVGKLREKLKIKQIHIESYEKFLTKKYKLQLSKKRTEEFNNNGIKNLNKLIIEKIQNIYTFNIINSLKNNEFKENKKETIVAYSGGIDSSYSLILAKYLGFNPIAITIDPGTIILPNQFKRNIEKLTKKLDVKQKYIKVNSSKIINESLNGKYHPCGRCSKFIEETIIKYAKNNKIEYIIYGDLLSTGYQSITKQDDNLYRINLPASLASTKQEIKALTNKYDLISFDNFGCPLLYEVHKKYPYFKKYSIQRILRETSAQALEPGESLDLIWSFTKKK